MPKLMKNEVIQGIRSLCYLAEIGETKSEINYQYCSDMKYATFYLPDSIRVKMSDRGFPICLFVVWYKNRARTETIRIIGAEGLCYIPKKNELEIIYDYYAAIYKKQMKKHNL